ncbi:hypothetical protein CPB83DRAFT_844039 [Crepidotus variabilis]|uniref:Uncharacterized protein n=1 Tax=Crepidotus variabilis TaxID=179855 RepID=A0A9P6JVA7_9AGAR|nr:hypothetical protein CPB83DRAFT_844039 [Crepidotus variabilis]
MLDKYLAPTTPEATANNHLTENWPSWTTDQPSVDEALISGCASYRAFDRYIGGKDLFLLPRTRSELESVLRRYAYDAIHNAIAISRSPLQTGGYSRVCNLAEKSIRAVLNTADNADNLLELHRPHSAKINHDMDDCACKNHSRPILSG